MDTESLCL